MRPILFCRQSHYAERNSEIVRAVHPRGVVRAHESVSRDSAATATNARGNYYDLRAGGRKSRAQCRHSVYDANGLARAVRDAAVTSRWNRVAGRL